MSDPTINNLEQIRNIIFGDESQKIEKRFAQIEKSIKDLKSSMQEAFADVEKKLQAQTDHTNSVEKSLQEEIKKAKSSLEQQLQAEVAKLEEQIQDLGRDKLDRQVLANLLIEMALNIKGESLMNTLTQEAGVDGNQE